MNDYILLMYADATTPVAAASWPPYLDALRASGSFQGGSAIGGGEALRKDRPTTLATAQVTGYIRLTALTLDEAKRFVIGNPVFECGGTVEVRELPRE